MNLNIVSKTQSISYVTAKMMLNLYLIFFFSVPFIVRNSSSKIDHKLLDSTDSSLTQTLLFGNSAFATIINCSTKIINLTIDFVLSTKRFDGPLLWTAIFFLSHSNKYKQTGIIYIAFVLFDLIKKLATFNSF